MKIDDGSQRDDVKETSADRIKVGIADYEVTADDTALTTAGLGSCVGVSLYDDETNTAGLVHVMLPVAEEMNRRKPAKFANTGTELLIAEMEAIGATKQNMEAKIAGGSRMLDAPQIATGIGDRNVRQVKLTLEEHGIPLIGEDVGGDYGRSIRLEPATGTLVVKSVTRGVKTL